MLAAVKIMKFLAGLYVLSVLALTMWPNLAHTDVPRWANEIIALAARFGISVTFSFLEAIANVFMFIPFGVFGVWLLGDWQEVTHETGVISRPSLVGVTAQIVLVGAAFSALIETTQLALPGRVTSFDDLWRNTLGALIGGTLCALVLAIRRRRHPLVISTRPYRA